MLDLGAGGFERSGAFFGAREPKHLVAAVEQLRDEG
jgi:hypothetical protein